LRPGGDQAPSGRCDERRANVVSGRVQPAASTTLRKETDRAPADGPQRVPSHVATEQFPIAVITRNAGKDGEILPWLPAIFYCVGVDPARMPKRRFPIRPDFRSNPRKAIVHRRQGPDNGIPPDLPPGACWKVLVVRAANCHAKLRHETLRRSGGAAEAYPGGR
jgi:hypothetical protein